MANKITVTRMQRSLWWRNAEASVISPSLILGKVWRRLTNYYRHWFCQQNYIFRHKGPFQEVDLNDCEFACYESFKDIPEQVKTDISSDGDPNRLKTHKLELSENALLWTALVDGRVASSVFTRKGKYFRRWFLDLQPEDVVVFRLRTHPGFRGRGLAPALIRHAIWSLIDKPGCAYIDCRTYNKPSIRCIEKAGFERIETKKTIKREWAMYD